MTYVTTFVYIRGERSGSIDFPITKDLENIDIEEEIRKHEEKK